MAAATPFRWRWMEPAMEPADPLVAFLGEGKKVWRSPGRVCLVHGSKVPILPLAAFGGSGQGVSACSLGGFQRGPA